MTTKRELVDSIAAAAGLPEVRVARVIDLFLEQVIEVLATEGRLELRNFAVFKAVEVKAHTGRNPRTGEPVDIPKTHRGRFKASKRLRERLRQE